MRRNNIEDKLANNIRERRQSAELAAPRPEELAAPRPAEELVNGGKLARPFCRYWCMSSPSFYAEIKRGELETILIGNRRFVTNEQEAAWLKRKEIAAKEQNKTLVPLY